MEGPCWRDLRWVEVGFQVLLVFQRVDTQGRGSWRRALRLCCAGWRGATRFILIILMCNAMSSSSPLAVIGAHAMRGLQLREEEEQVLAQVRAQYLGMILCNQSLRGPLLLLCCAPLR